MRPMRARQAGTCLVIHRPQGSEGLAKIVALTFSEEPKRLSGLRDAGNARCGVEGDRLGRLSTWAPSPLAVTSSVGSLRAAAGSRQTEEAALVDSMHKLLIVLKAALRDHVPWCSAS